MIRRNKAFRPFAARSRRALVAIVATFAFFSVLSVGLSISATTKSQNRATVVEVAARQRTLAERYLAEVLLARAGGQSDPAYVGWVLGRSARALLQGGIAPPVNGDDDEVELPRETDRVIRAQLQQGRRLVGDLTRTGAALLHPGLGLRPRLTSGEHIANRDPVMRLRVLTALASNVALNAARSIAASDDRNIAHVVTLQVTLGITAFLLSLLLAWALVAATRRQAANFRSLVNSSTDLILVFGRGGCRYASPSVSQLVGSPETELFEGELYTHVHSADVAKVRAAATSGEPRELVFRVRNRFGEWRALEAHITDLRADRRIRGVVFNARDISERLALEQQLTHQAFHDVLTGLPNRALFRDRLDHALARTVRSNDALAVLLVDLDGFKQVNDTLGHDAGDRLLQEVSRRFRVVVRGSDTVARLGGDEFAVLLEEIDEQSATAAAERLLSSLETPVTVEGREFILGASIGVAFHPGGPTDDRDLIRDADIAMYAAKERGRGCHELFRVEMMRGLGELLGIEHELRLGLTRGEFALHYQPMIDLRTERVIGMEALLRWTSPTRGIVPPARFIPIAEATGLIVPLGEFVILSACEQAAAWSKDGAASFVTWVNVSAKQLGAGGTIDVIRQALKVTDLPPSRLGIEITESAIVEPGISGERTRAELEELHRLGVQIAIDDFGTGFSSLGQLRHFPIDMIKVDRSFIEGIDSDSKDATITSSLISLAHALDVVAIAEGIESRSQLESVRSLGCDHAQGYLFGRPVAAEQITRMVVRGRQAEAEGPAAEVA